MKASLEVTLVTSGKAAAGVTVSKCWWGREIKTSIVVKCGDFKTTIRLTWGRQTDGGNGGQSVAGTEVGVGFHLMLQRLGRCLPCAEGAVQGAGACHAASCAGQHQCRESRVGFRQSWNRDKMQQAGGGDGMWPHGSGTPGDDACTMNCLNAERSFTSLASLKPPGLLGGEGSVIRALLLNNYLGLCFWK